VHCGSFALTSDMRRAPKHARPSPSRWETMENINETSTVTAPRSPWNKGKLVGPKPPLQPKYV
jgi:hypothetical protein